MLAARASQGATVCRGAAAVRPDHPTRQQQHPRARGRRRGGRASAAGGGGERAAPPPPAPPRVRRARPEDVPAIAALERASAPLSAGWTAAQVEEELPREIAVVLVAEAQSDGEEEEKEAAAAPAGWAAAWRVAGELQVLAIAVDPSRRRAGVGRALLAELLALAEEEEEQPRGGHPGDHSPAPPPPPPPPLATLELRADNAAAAALYASCGFLEVGRRRGYYDGGAVDAVLLQKPRPGG